MTVLGCSAQLQSDDATFDSGLPRAFQFSGYLKAAEPEAGAWFGYAMSIDPASVAVAAPFETLESDGALRERGGAVYFFAPENLATAPARLDLPHVDAYDGQFPSALLPMTLPPEFWGAIGPLVSERFVLTSVLGEDSAYASDPTDNSAPEAGAVYAFDRDALETPPQYIKAPNAGRDDLFGFGLAQAGDWLAVGAPGEDSAPGAGMADDSFARSGAAYLYRLQDGKFVDPVFVKPDDLQPGDFFGSTIVMSDEVLVVAAPATAALDEMGHKQPNVGALYVFRLEAERWTFEKRIPAPATQSMAFFASSLALSGNVLAVGAPGVATCGEGDTNGGFRGAVYLFSEQNADWLSQPEQCLPPRSGHADAFGWSVAVEGDVLVVGAPLDSSASTEDPANADMDRAGAAYVFARGASDRWSELQYLKSPNRDVLHLFGWTVDVAAGRIAIAAHGESGTRAARMPEPGDAGSPESGAVYFFNAQ